MKERWFKVGCGCGRSSRNKASIIKKRLRTASLNLPKKNEMSNRESICLSCPYSALTGKEKKIKIRVCHKLNRLIINISRNKIIKCPIGKF